VDRTQAPRETAKERRSAAWGEPARAENRWPAQVAVLAALALYITLPAKLTVGPAWFIPVLELALFVPLALTAPKHLAQIARWRRPAAISLIGVINLANIISLVLLIHELLRGGTRTVGAELLLGATQIWVTNIIVFALWYWELDRGGPDARRLASHGPPDFLFPQMVTPACAPAGWTPKFVDYLFISFTNATAFSPTDTMPLSTWAKMLFTMQAATSLLTVAIVAARAVNILT
jgi:uncharacterized membrane protein